MMQLIYYKVKRSHQVVVVVVRVQVVNLKSKKKVKERKRECRINYNCMHINILRDVWAFYWNFILCGMICEV